LRELAAARCLVEWSARSNVSAQHRQLLSSPSLLLFARLAKNLWCGGADEEEEEEEEKALLWLILGCVAARGLGAQA
jgi:hypothetical protein